MGMGGLGTGPGNAPRANVSEITEISELDVLVNCVFQFPITHAAIIREMNHTLGLVYKIDFTNPNKEAVANARRIHKCLDLFGGKSIIDAEYVHNPPRKHYEKIAKNLELILLLTQSELNKGLELIKFGKHRLSDLDEIMLRKISAYPSARFEYSSKEFKTRKDAYDLVTALELKKTNVSRFSSPGESFKIYRQGVFKRTYLVTGWKSDDVGDVTDFSKKFYEYKDKFESLELFYLGKVERIYPKPKPKK